MAAYYNEIDPYCAQWLRNLIKDGHIADGLVDVRSIEDVRPADLAGFTQCHFFAGIGGWSHALRLAGWPDDRPVWTGSCPCQPFSTAGKGAGFADERHLWPAFYWLISQCRPAILFGEQVASKAGLDWLDLVCADLEGAGYASTAFDICAAGVDAPQIRQRLWWMGRAGSMRCHQGKPGDGPSEASEGGAYRPIADRSGALGNRLGGTRPAGLPSDSWAWVECSDGKARPIESGTFPLCDGLPARVGRLRAYGNAVVPQVAAAFIRSFIESH